MKLKLWCKTSEEEDIIEIRLSNHNSAYLTKMVIDAIRINILMKSNANNKRNQSDLYENSITDGFYSYICLNHNF